MLPSASVMLSVETIPVTVMSSVPRGELMRMVTNLLFFLDLKKKKSKK